MSSEQSFWSGYRTSHLRVTCPKCALVIEDPNLRPVYGEAGIVGHDTDCPRCGKFAVEADPVGDGQFPYYRRSWCPHCDTFLSDPFRVRLADGAVELLCFLCGRKHSRTPNNPESLVTFPPDILRGRIALPDYDPDEESP